MMRIALDSAFALYGAMCTARLHPKQPVEFVLIKFEPCIHLIMVIVLHSPE